MTEPRAGMIVSVQQRLPSLLETPILFAHRGARAHARENTIEAFALALRLGATGLESDVWITADGVAVLDHDGVVRSAGASARFPSAPPPTCPTTFPRCASCSRSAAPRYHLSLDLKQDGSDPQ